MSSVGQSVMHTRRDFLKVVGAAAAAAPLVRAGGPFRGTLCLFSKHLPGMDWQRMAQSVKQLGFGGVDLTVRPGGHVLPERAAEDLPKAVAAIRDAGLAVPMITTGLVSASDPAARPTLATAGKLGVPFFKPGYYKYQFVDVRRELAQAGQDFRGLAELGKQSGVQVGFHNHEGYIGGPVWDIAGVIDTLDPQWVGYYFDVRHAVAEGGGAGWKIATNLVAKRLKMLAVKDFYWEKTAKGWRSKNCPLGEGAVDWKTFFRLVSQAGFHGPISLHLEYDIPGATASAVEDETLASAARDLGFLTARLREAYAEQG